MKKLVVTLAAVAVALAMMEAPANAAAPTLSATYVSGSPDDFWFFINASKPGWVPGCDPATIQVTAFGVTYGQGDLDHVDVYGGWNEAGERYAQIDFGLVTDDPGLQPQAGDFTDAAISCTEKWRTASYVRKTFRGSVSKAGVKTSSRSWSRLSLGGSCDYSRYSGELLASCLWGRSTVTYNLTSPRHTRITGASASMEAGLFACHTSVAKRQTSRRTIRLTLTTSNPNGFAQCWIKRVKATYKGHHRVKVWTTHRATAPAEWHAV
jgi:hypothetical protein